jgi:hypothetical protein
MQNITIRRLAKPILVFDAPEADKQNHETKEAQDSGPETSVE